MAETALIISAVVSAGAAIQQGRAASKAAEFERKGIEQQMEQSRIKALDDELQRRRQLADTLGEGAAMGAQSGFDPTAAGSSFLALREETIKESGRDVDMIRLIGANQLGNFALEDQQYKVAGKAARTGSYLQAAGSLAQGAGQLATLRSSMNRPQQRVIIEK